jgi:prevent-host-death family protein
MYTTAYTQDVAKHVAVREFRANLSALLSEVVDRHEHVVVTRNGQPAAALISIRELRSLEETIEILSDPELVAAIEEGRAEAERGETVSFEEVQRELAARRGRND